MLRLFALKLTLEEDETLLAGKPPVCSGFRQGHLVSQSRPKIIGRKKEKASGVQLRGGSGRSG